MDKWSNRALGMRCHSCMWFLPKSSHAEPRCTDASVELQEAEPLRSFGRCRRHAPTMTGFPPVFGEDWCGDHKLDEEAAHRVS